MSDVFKVLSAVDVSGKTKKKSGFDYIPWACAWDELKKHFPDATYRVYEDANGTIYHSDGRTAWVKVGVTVDGIENVELYPVMDYRNEAKPIETVTSTDANYAIQRACTKAIARHGLGLKIYMNEEFAEEEQDEKKSDKRGEETQKPKKQTAGTTNVPVYTPVRRYNDVSAESNEIRRKQPEAYQRATQSTTGGNAEPDARQKCIDLYEENGLNPEQIGKDFGVSKKTTAAEWAEIYERAKTKFNKKKFLKKIDLTPYAEEKND